VWISPWYARFLGWLDYKPAIPVLEAVLQDSLLIDGYAANNKAEFTLSCKLALARMGNKKYENELLNEYKNMELDCSRHDFNNPLNDLFYINTINSINQVIAFSKNEKVYQGIHPEHYRGATLPPCTAKPGIYLYLSTIIKNYPLEYLFGYKIDFYSQDVVRWADEAFYKDQIPKLEKWIEENKTYIIDTERLF
jgi:hypothetical protein